MKFLIVGDIVGNSGMSVVKENLHKVIAEENIDFCIINGENATGGKGIKERELQNLYEYGADVVTMGNHIYYRKEAKELYKNIPNLLIPANVTNLEGHGLVLIEKDRIKIGVINLIGKVNMGEVNSEFIENPFGIIKEKIKILKDKNADYIFIDFHAETTAEKIAMAHFLKEDITCLFGTHTHVQTADEKIFDTGMAYITDVGMTGPEDSVLGLRKDIAISRFVTGEKIRYECSNNKGKLHSIIVETDDVTKKSIGIQRYNR